MLWSPRSVTSDWVRTEAHYGKDRGKLVPALIEPCTIPIAFTLNQTVNLHGWSGDRDNRQWRKLLTWITDLISTKPGNANLPGGLVSAGAPNVYRDSIGSLPSSGEPIYDGAFINPHTPPGTLFRDGEQMPVMRIVPKGLFLLGTTSDDPDRASYEVPQKRVDIPASFAIGVFPVLISEYVKLAGRPLSAPPPPAVTRRLVRPFPRAVPAARAGRRTFRSRGGYSGHKYLLRRSSGVRRPPLVRIPSELPHPLRSGMGVCVPRWFADALLLRRYD